jgi:hypothetical protein
LPKILHPEAPTSASGTPSSVFLKYARHSDVAKSHAPERYPWPTQQTHA